MPSIQVIWSRLKWSFTDDVIQHLCIDRSVDVPAPRLIWEPRDEGSLLLMNFFQFNGVKSLVENELTCSVNKH